MDRPREHGSADATCLASRAAGEAIRRTYLHTDFDLDGLVAAKGTTAVSVVIPARNEAATVGDVVCAVSTCMQRERGLVDEVIVVDDGSGDATGAIARAAGARVVCPSGNAGPGKGRAMRAGARAALGDVILFLDADVVNTGQHFVVGMLGPLLTDPSVQLVKGSYTRPLGDAPAEGGRVTELVARPVISLLHPELAFLTQPLSGECAVRRSVFESLELPDDYGVEMAVLLGVRRRFGHEAIAQCDLGVRVHRNRPLAELVPIARSVLDAALRDLRAPAAEDGQAAAW